MNDGIHVMHCFENSHAAVSLRVTISQFSGLVCTDGGACRDRRGPAVATVKHNRRFDRWITPRIKNFPCSY
ncbi:MAG: hypothetical protein UY49_C0021G0016 [Microgenomates group bacterium GW2011_GWC1_49_7]|nr:MAG: hypothetical protein UY49_C0021G0016 [Microgenomates group bacterium GW2011_GWC1_49_7]